MHFKPVLRCVISPVKSIAVSSAIQSLSREIHCLASPFSFAHLSFWCLGVKEYVLYGENTLPYRKKNVLHGENPKNGQFRSVLRLFSNTVIQGWGVQWCDWCFYHFNAFPPVPFDGQLLQPCLVRLLESTSVSWSLRVPDPILQLPVLVRLSIFLGKRLAYN